MAASVRVAAPAKVNLHLRVYGRREDGFHDLLSLFQAVTVADDIVVRSLKGRDTIRVTGSFDCRPEDTTVYKAARAFMRISKLNVAVSIEVHKTIPSGAGLGGGSSDGAATLRALDALFETGLPLEELAAAAAEVGSDVPFFISGGCALVEGRGERVDPLVSRADLAFVIHFPGFPVSSAGAYGLLDRMRPSDAGEPDPSPEAIRSAYRGRPGSWPFANSFQPWIEAAHPAVAAARRRLLDRGARFAAMTGSGSSVFGVFETRSEAEQALRELRAGPGEVFLAFPLARLPALD
ncbi:MAG TPA: 4-(cytidine 5'-diphospho)-2-C-methyl-D-erythritol kinase [Rectinemataceae bacterium]|nr:4-(cytidine 5'-diphospho)-2-C-methyl-D-erythritol kinase [Rectinemataceae bacterium]